jgi:hypothetical protein
MMGREWTKSQRRVLRELAARAYDRELTRELGAIETDFVRWRRGEIDVHALSEQIHRFHNGPARRLYLDYTGSHLELAVGAAIGRGILTEAEATPEILQALKGLIELARERWDEDDDESDDSPPGKAPTD